MELRGWTAEISVMSENQGQTMLIQRRQSTVLEKTLYLSTPYWHHICISNMIGTHGRMVLELM